MPEEPVIASIVPQPCWIMRIGPSVPRQDHKGKCKGNRYYPDYATSGHPVAFRPSLTRSFSLFVATLFVFHAQVNAATRNSVLPTRRQPFCHRILHYS